MNSIQSTALMVILPRKSHEELLSKDILNLLFKKIALFMTLISFQYC